MLLLFRDTFSTKFVQAAFVLHVCRYCCCLGDPCARFLRVPFDVFCSLKHVLIILMHSDDVRRETTKENITIIQL